MRVQGSLDAPPIVMRQDRTKTSVGLLGSAAFVAVGVFLIRTGRPDAVAVGCLSIAFFGLCGVGWGWSFIRPGGLTIGPEGVEERVAWRTRRWPWGELGVIRLAQIQRTKLVAFDYSPGWPVRKMTALSRSLSGMDGGLGGGWPLSADDLVDLLNQAKQRWG